MRLCPLLAAMEPTLYIIPDSMLAEVVAMELLPAPLLLGGWVEFEVELLEAVLFAALV